MIQTKSDVADVVSHCGVSVLQLQRRFFVTEQHLRSRVTGPPALLKLLNTEKHRHQSVLSSLNTHTSAVLFALLSLLCASDFVKVVQLD